MQLLWKRYQLRFNHPFGVSSNTRTETTSVFVQLKSEDETGYGEACLPAYLGHSPERTERYLRRAAELLRNYDATMPLSFFLEEMMRLSERDFPAKAAVDMALHDLYGKLSSVPVWKLINIQEPLARETAFTIGITNGGKIAAKIEEAKAFPILKIKAGTEDDRELIQLVREHTDKPLYIDVNQGWRDRERVVEMLHWMKERGVILVEQPMPVDMLEDMRWICEQSPLPLIADESMQSLSTLDTLQGAFNGINIKLAKCGGIAEALKIMDRARRIGMKIMTGCMAESSCGVAAMAQLMSKADYVDLDAPLLYKNDPFSGVTYEGGRISITSGPGISAQPREDLFEHSEG